MQQKLKINLTEFPRQEKRILFNTMFIGIIFGLFVGFSVSCLVIQFAIYKLSNYLICMPI